MAKDIYDNKEFMPMLLNEALEPFDDPNYIFEMKFDGTRTLIFVEPNNILIRNKRGIVLNDTYPELLDIKKLVKNKVIFDGEIVLMVDGKPSFRKLQERALLKDKMKIIYFKENHPVTFVAYDILYDGKDITELPLIERKKQLAKYQDTEYFVKTKYIEDKGIALYKAVREVGLEGIVAKVKNSQYLINKRSKNWVKIKNWNDEEFYVCGYKEKTEGHMASIIIASLIDGKYNYVGRVTIGKNNSEFKMIKKLKKINKNYLIDFLHDNEDYILVEPKFECTIEFLEKTKTGKLRQPIFKGLRLD